MPRALRNRTNHFGEFIRHRRKELNKTQLEIAKALGLSSSEFIGMIELGTRQPNLERLPELALALKVKTFSLAKLAMMDVYPNLAKTIFRNKQEFLSQERHRRISEDDLLSKLDALPHRISQPIIDMINHFYEESITTQIKKQA